MSDIKIYIDSVEKPINDIINEKLKDANLPSCFGSMIPPIILKKVKFNSTDILAHKHSLVEEDIYDFDINHYIDNEYNETYEDMVITNKGVEYIKTYKETLASIYVAQVIKCSTCTYWEVCNVLTQNYLKALELNEIVR